MTNPGLPGHAATSGPNEAPEPADRPRPDRPRPDRPRPDRRRPDQPGGDVVGVLLPVRLETRFLPPGPAGRGPRPAPLLPWRLQVRVVPDFVSMDRHDPVPTPDELDAIGAFWPEVASSGLDSEEGAAAWRRLAGRLGAARAAWLARTFPAQDGPGGTVTIHRPASSRDEPLVSRLAGLPPTIELWMARGGGAPVRAATMTVKPDLLTVELPDLAAGEERWWSSWPLALDAGLAAQIDLGQSRPDDIDVLYAVGIGGGPPTALFAAHRDSGDLAVMALGTPTNAVDGEPAANLADDPETWRKLVVAAGNTSRGAGGPDGPAGSDGTQPGTAAVSAALTGQAGALAPLPGGEDDHVAVDQALVRTLWPVLWGHALGSIWGVGEHLDDLAIWASENLVPEGPLPPVRIGDQPYGLLPATSITRWRAAAGDPPIEAGLRTTLLDLRGIWVAAAEAVGTARGADTDRLLALLSRTPVSTGYRWRWFLPVQLFHALSWIHAAPLQRSQLSAWWEAAAAPVVGLGARPTRQYGAMGWPQDLAIPLVEPDNLPPGVTWADALERLAAASPRNLASGPNLAQLFPRLPNSLLFRLALHALVTSGADVAVVAGNGARHILEAVAAKTDQPTRLEHFATRFTDAMLDARPASVRFREVRNSIRTLADQPAPEVERALRATVDTASHRLDPWLIGLPWRRLRTMSEAPRQLGVYGWVDRPQPRPAGGPVVPDEFLLAPSYGQALTAAVLRDRATSDPEAARWRMNLDSDAVRAADQLASEVRLGSHISEVLGRAVERAVASSTAVRHLRTTFPIRAEHRGRRVCDGQAVLAAFAANPSGLGLSAAQLGALAPLAHAVDAYGDLLVADGVHAVVSGRGAGAGPAMDAAAGLAPPPDLDVLRTQRGGKAVHTTVLTVLPDAPPPAPVTAATSPATLADPAVAAFLEAATGGAGGPGWTWQVVDAGGSVAGQVNVAAAGLAAIDTLSLSTEDLRAAAAAAAGHEPSQLRPMGPLPGHGRAQRLAAALGSQPATAADAGGDTPEPDAAVHADLLDRYAQVRQAAALLVGQLQAAPDDPPAQQAAAVQNALRWAVTPTSADDGTAPTLLRRAAAALRSRLEAAPDDGTAADLSVARLAQAIAELVSPEGRVPILSRLRRDQLPAGLVPDPPGGSALGTSLDPHWLEVVAAVRRPLARLEALHLDDRRAGRQPLFSAWTTLPGDPWATADGAAPMVATFALPGALDAAAPTVTFAVGLVDAWGETIPSREHVATAAFHFDAPAARPPQAILLAVPPVPGAGLDADDMVAIVAETRLLARARMATPADLGSLSAALPLAMLPAMGPTGVRLEPA